MTLDQLLQTAIAHHRAGRLAQAEPLYRQVLAQRPNDPTALHLLGVASGQSGQLEVAIDLIRRAIAVQPEAFYHINLGKFLTDAGRLDEAEAALRESVRIGPAVPETHFLLGMLLDQRGQPEPAVACMREALRLRPQFPEAVAALGVALYKLGRQDEAIAALREALRQRPDYAEAHNNLAGALHGSGRTDEALLHYRAALRLRPGWAEIHRNAAQALASLGRWPEAIAAYREAVRLQPRDAGMLNDLGNALRESGNATEAIACFRTALQLRPDFAETHNNLAVALLIAGDTDQAIDALQTALRLLPDDVTTLSNLAYALKDRGQLAESAATCRRALQLQPDAHDIHSNLIFAMPFDPACDAKTILAECRLWQQRHAHGLLPSPAIHPNDPSPERPLRIGYVAPDFRDHCQALFTVPIFAHHDRATFHITAYSDVLVPDAVTSRLQGFCHAWRNIVGAPDEQVAELVRRDAIDILVDLTMHMGRNRLRVFARKPAPVQVTWLAYPGTTGLDAVDYRLTDPHLDPPGRDDSIYAEQSLRLPETFWCYDPLTDVPPVNALPALAGGAVTFGCLNNPCKVNDQVLRLWAQVLRAVPRSRLLLLAPPGLYRRHVCEVMGAAGVAAERLDMVARQPRPAYLETYLRIDLGLDTVPYNGHTTSLDSCWMGVPVITLVGSTVVGRAGLSQLTNLGLPDLIAQTPNDFVRLAAALAGDLPRLQELRATLRARMQRSPLMDAPRFARNIEAAYRLMWRRWCRTLT